ncbi:MAG: histidine kinase [Sphingomonadaceae bacterium]|nr:histidine kinase [Sphingomonadaceae bacterium]
MTISATAAVVTGMVLAAWLGIAVRATLVSMQRKTRGERAADAARKAGALLENAPAAFLIVDTKDRIQAGPQAAEWLGFENPPKRIDDLKSVLKDESYAALAEAVRSAQRTARPFGLELPIAGSQRILFAQGGPAPTIFGGEENAIIWLFDASEMRAEVATLQSQTHRTGEALAALSALIEASPFPMWHRGADLRLTLVNQAYVRAVETENAAEVIARGLELIELGGADSAQAVAAMVREEGEPHSRTVPATIGGERRAMRIVDIPLGEAGVAGYAIDIEELEQARAELRRFARAQRDMLDLLSAGVAQFGPDRSLSFSNQPFQRIFAMQDEWLADAPEFDRVLDRMREADRVPAERDFPAWKEARRSWFQKGDEPIEEAWHLPDGTHLRVVAQPLPDGGLLLIFEDRTEQAQLASARDTLLRVRTATFDNLFEALGVFASDGRLHLWNARFRQIWNFEEATLAEHPRIDELIEQIAPNFDGDDEAGAIRDAVRVATLDRKQQEGRFRLNDGRSFEYAAVPLPDGNALVTLLDISDSEQIQSALRERNEALEAADRVKTAFVSNMSYELRTPLTSIPRFAEMLDGGYAGELPGQASDYVAAILTSVAKLRTQIDEVLDLTQSEAGGLPMAADTVDLKVLCDEAVAEVREAADVRQHKLSIEIDTSVGSITGDARRLRQALDHLLHNAVRYTPEGGKVDLRADGDAQEARITITDNGPGIAPADQHKVFDRFHRADADAQSRALGLGLPLTKQFVEAHGGSIRLSSEAGRGTSVTITLPRGGVSF